MSLIINKKRLCATLLSSIVIAVTLMVNPSTLLVFSQEETPILTYEPILLSGSHLELVTSNDTFEDTSGWPGPDKP
jgi:hypothetical protein